MKRKVVQLAHRTLVVSLPHKWADKYGVKKGDEVEVDDSGSSLVVHSGKAGKEKREIIFNLKEGQKFMLRMLCGPYLKGYTTIKIYYTNPKQYQDIKNSPRYMIGFEVVEQGKNFVKLEEISAGTEENFTNIISRMFYILKSFLEEIHDYLKKPYDNIQDLREMELSCNRLALYTRRLLNQNIIPGKVYENTGLYHVVCLIERSSDELAEIVGYFMEKGSKKYAYDKKLEPLFRGLGDAIDLTIKKTNNYLGNRDYDKQVGYATEQRKIRAEIKSNPDAYLESSKENAYVYWHLVNISEHIQHMSEEFF